MIIPHQFEQGELVSKMQVWGDKLGMDCKYGHCRWVPGKMVNFHVLLKFSNQVVEFRLYFLLWFLFS